MFYKSDEISFSNKKSKVSNLCVYNDFYYFESDAEIPQAETISAEEFEQAISSIVHVTLESVEPKLTAAEQQEARETYIMAML